jgi:Ca2+/Na+ antiporter
MSPIEIFRIVAATILALLCIVSLAAYFLGKPRLRFRRGGPAVAAEANLFAALACLLFLYMLFMNMIDKSGLTIAVVCILAAFLIVAAYLNDRAQKRLRRERR